MLFTKLFMTSSTLLFIASTTTTKTVASKASNTIPIWNTKQQQHTNHDNNHRQFNNNNNIHNIIDDSSSNNEIEVSIREQQEDKIHYDGQIHYDDDDNSTVSILPTHDEQYQQHSSANNGIENEITYKSNSKQWKIEEGLPIELQNRATLHKLHIDGCDIYLLGTSHVSKKSCHDVTILMNHIVPDCLFIELCPQRIPILMPPSTTDMLQEQELKQQPTSSSSSSKNNNNNESFSSQIHTLQTQTGMSYCSAFSTILLTKVQSNYASKLDIQAGAEFQQAYQSKSKLCRVILGDRPVKISLVRSWESLSIFGKIKLFLCLLYSSMKQPSEKDIEEWMEKVLNDENNDILSKSIKEFTKHFPTIQNIIMTERDLYMYAKIRQTIQCLRCKKLVAIVGAGHCQGIVSLFQNNNHDGNDSKGIDNGNNFNILLRGIVETKKMKVDDDYIMSLTTDVIELHDTSNTYTNSVM